MISSPVEEIKNRLDIVEVIGNYIKLQKAGANFRAVCPFHTDKKPSFFVSPVRQIWHCFGCSKGGDIFAFIKNIEGVEFGDALRILAQKAGVELIKQDPKIKSERDRLYQISELACRFFEKQLESSLIGKEAKNYLLGRGIKEETVKKWRLGWAPDNWQALSDFLVSNGYNREEIEKAGLCLKSEKTNNYYDRFRNRIIFPVFDFNRQIIGFGGRVFKQTKRADGQEEAKYINTPSTLLYDKSRILYGLDKAGIEIRKKDSCILVEGYVDAIMASQAGSENVVANSGTALTPYQLKILKRYSSNLLTAYDMDSAGDSATKRGIDLAQAQGFDIKIVVMPQDLDPADVIQKNPGDWQNLIEKAKSIHDFYFEDILSRFDKNTLKGKKEISKALLPVIKKIPNKIEQAVWVHDLADNLSVKEENVLEELKKTGLEQQYEYEKENDAIISEIPKTRKELLEERLIVLAIKSPEKISLLTNETDLGLLSDETTSILSSLKNNGKDSPSDKLDVLFLRSEIDPLSTDKEIDKEFKECLREIKTLAIKCKLEGISKEIKEAENDNNFGRIQELSQKFSECSRGRNDLEISEI